jgi:ribonuclease Z
MGPGHGRSVIVRPSFHPFLVNDPFGDPALYVDFLFEKRALLFDLGDIRNLPPKKMLRLTDIFVSHCHMDHFMGFDWLLRICLGRELGIRMYGPPGFIDQVEHKLAAYTWNLVERYDTDFTFRVTEVQPDGVAHRAEFHCRQAFSRSNEGTLHAPNGSLLEETGLSVRCSFLDHRTPCLAFSLQESRHVNIWKNRLADLGLAVGPWLKELKRMVLADQPDGTQVMAQRADGTQTALSLGTLKEEVVRIVPGSKISYVTDAVFSAGNAQRIVEIARDADLLFIEAVFAHELAERAREKCHLTAAQAGWLAHGAGAKTVIPFHHSPIYKEEPERLRQELEQALRTGCMV